jgi:hypothetical protein
MDKLDKKELWVGWTHDAIANYMMPEDVEDADELVDDMADVATKYADAMLAEYEARFEGASARKRKSSKKKRDEDLDDDDDEDEDDD